MAELNETAYTQAGWERNAYLACACLIIYEYALQLDNEVEFFWKQRWSLAKSLFLWSRYYSLGFNVSNAAIFLIPRPSYMLCNKFFHWQNTGAALQVITTHLILQLRLYAMYGSTRRMMYAFMSLTTCESLMMGLVFGIPNPKLIGTNEPFPSVYICADADPYDGSRWVVYYWVSVLFVEGILFGLALRKAWQHRRAVHGSGLMQQLTKDSVIYFFFIFWIYCANMILWCFNRITLNELGTAPAFVISSILANRLLISVRTTYHSKLDNHLDPATLSMHFAPGGTGNVEILGLYDSIPSAGVVMELESFHRRVGSHAHPLVSGSLADGTVSR